jgi:hypothetical protein
MVRAHDLCLARGCGPGRDVVDWMEVERELSSQTSDAARLLNRFGRKSADPSFWREDRSG